MSTIQFFGLPGSGKTYLFNKLRERLITEKYSVVSREEMVIEALRNRDDGQISRLIKKTPPVVWHRVIHEDYCLQELLDFIGKNPAMYSFLFKVFEQADIEGKYLRALIGSFARTSIEHELLTSSPNGSKGLFLTDEWFYHRLYTLSANCKISPDYKKVKEYIELVPITDGAIFIATPPEVCFDRIYERRDIPEFLSNLSCAEQKAILIQYYQLFEVLVSVLEKEGYSLITYDGISDEIEKIVGYCREIACDPCVNEIC